MKYAVTPTLSDAGGHVRSSCVLETTDSTGVPGAAGACVSAEAARKATICMIHQPVDEIAADAL